MSTAVFKHLAVLSMLAVFAFSLAQAQWTTSGTNIFNSNTGNVGVGVTAPSAKLEIANGNSASFRVGITSNLANMFSQFLASAAVVGYDNTSTATNAAVAWNFYNNGTSPSFSGTLVQHVGTAVAGNSYGVAAANQGQLVFQNVSNGLIASNGANIFISPGGTVSTSFLTNGSVGIGTSSPGPYLLAVNGSAIFTKAVVKLYASWPDYVFKEDYKLPTLDNLEKYVKANNHLPEMPSAADVEKDGIDLGQGQAQLLKKMEELTLYMIELNKKIDAVSKENGEMKKKLGIH